MEYWEAMFAWNWGPVRRNITSAQPFRSWKPNAERGTESRARPKGEPLKIGQRGNSPFGRLSQCARNWDWLAMCGVALSTWRYHCIFRLSSIYPHWNDDPQSFPLQRWTGIYKLTICQPNSIWSQARLRMSPTISLELHCSYSQAGLKSNQSHHTKRRSQSSPLAP